MAETSITSTALDFDNIKDSLKIYLKAKPEFADYNFDASGLSNILDVLAYNTHFNGLIANFALNESFINTAQLRSSVVSHAEALGYRPKSKTPSTSSVSFYVNLAGVQNRPSQISVPAGWTFQASNEDSAFTFITTEAYTAQDQNNNGVYSFTADGGSPIIISQGSYKTKTFIVDDSAENQIYVIPDENLDTNRVTVKVYDDLSSDRYTPYFFLENAINIDETTTYFNIKEAPNGYYEVNFGDGKSFGKSPSVGNKVVIEYFSTSGAEANGCSGFLSTSQLTVNGIKYPVYITSQTISAGGFDRESIESIRKLAPLQFASQKRLVTANDYKSMILSNFPVIKDVGVWGGEDNVPVDYGTVYISLQYGDDVSDAVKTETQNKITSDFTDKLSILSIRNKFVEPKETYLELTGTFNYDPSLTASSSTALQTQVQEYIKTYFTNNLNKFESSFKRSQLLTEIAELDRSIIASMMNVKLQQREEITLGSAHNYDIYFPVQLMPARSDQYTIQSTFFTYGNNLLRCSVKNKKNSEILQVISVSGEVIVDDIGYFNYKKGHVRLRGFAPASISSGNKYISFSALPLDPSIISPLRNYLIRVDRDILTMKAIKNNQDTRVVL